MALKTFVKISNVNNLSDARYCAGMMVDIIGFDIDPTSANRISPEDFKEITEWVAGVKFAGEFLHSTKATIVEASNEYLIDFIQIEDFEQVEEIHLLGKPMIFKMHIENAEDVAKIKSKLSYLDELVRIVILKCSNEDLFEKIDDQIGYYNGNLKLLKGYGLENNQHLEKFPGLELEALKEERPGFKDYGQVMDVLETIEED
ncbi:MAG: hypothetical protein AAGC64_04975 [Bacteroidota bacterium]